jgi:hypothetical protein|nr:MAG TPA: hypothetical protein [Caudoviricetes sp.]DAU41160.1 MAG TPA: hypothetical protein [Caudoviricetes sp.]
MNCKLCGAKIQFIRTPAGKYLPCNPRAVTYYKGQYNKNRIVTPAGKVIACEMTGSVSQVAGIGFIPHWSSCKGNSKSVRKAKEQTLF